MNCRKIQKVLVYRLGSLGDTLVALPAFRLVRESFPSAEITILTHTPLGSKAASLASVLEGTSLCQKVLSYPLQTRSLVTLAQLRRRIIEGQYEVVIYLAEDRGLLKSFRDLLFLCSCGIGTIMGLPWEDTRLHEERPGLARPEHRRLLGRLRRLGRIDLDAEKWWDLELGLTELEQARAVLEGISGPFFAVSLGTKAEVNDWTESNWQALLTESCRRWPGYSLVMLGAGSEWDSADRCSRHWSGDKLNLCGKTTPRVSGAILRRAELFIGHDSGPLHLAATVGTRCVGIYSARSAPGRWFPRGSGHKIIYHKTPCFNCGLQSCTVHGKKCILSITVEEVLSAMEYCLRESVQNLREPCEFSMQSGR